MEHFTSSSAKLSATEQLSVNTNRTTQKATGLYLKVLYAI